MSVRVGREARGYLLFGGMFYVLLQVHLTVAIVWWPAFRDNTGALKKLASPMPFLAEKIDLMAMLGVPGYVVGQHYFKFCNTLGTLAAVLFAMGAIAAEAQRGTLEIWLARPVTRLRLYTERYFAGLAALVLPVLVSSLTATDLLTIVDETMKRSHLALCSLHQGLFLGAIYSLTFLLSALGSEPLRIGLWMLFLTAFEFAIYMVKTITHYSMYRLVDIEAFAVILKEDRLDWRPAAGCLAVSAACYCLGLAAFRRRVP